MAGTALEKQTKKAEKQKRKHGRRVANMKDIRERTFDFALRIIKLCQQLEQEGGVGRTLGWQLLRSGTSVGANVEEARAKANWTSLVRMQLH